VLLVASFVDDILNSRDAQVGVDHCIGDIPWGVYNADVVGECLASFFIVKQYY